MRFDYLKTFLTVARTHSFSTTAKELGISQGTVSHHIAELEKYFNAELLKRAAKGVEVTEAGAILKEAAQTILNDVDNTKVKISTTRHKLFGVIRIVASTIPGEHIVPSLIAGFQKKYADVKFRIRAEDSVTSLFNLQVGEADFAVVGTLSGYEGTFDTIPIGEEELVLIVSPTHELAKRKTVKLNEILKYPYINREETSGTRKEVEQMFEAAGVSASKLQTILELGSTEAVITAVSEGIGISVISSIASKKAQAASLVTILKIDDAMTARKLYLAKPKRKLVKTSEVFWEFCKQYLLKKVKPIS